MTYHETTSNCNQGFFIDKYVFDEKYVCQFCNISFKNCKNNLEQHLNAHFETQSKFCFQKSVESRIGWANGESLPSKVQIL